MLTAPRDVLQRRARSRGRHDLVPTLGGIDSWLADFERRDGVADFPGRDAVDGTVVEPGVASRAW